MVRLCCMLSLIVLFVPCRPLSAPADSTAGPWRHDLTFRFQLSQASFTNWEQGGENALAYRASLEGTSVRQDSSLTWTTSYQFVFGQTKAGNQGVRKNDDNIALETILGLRSGPSINPFVSVSLQTQFANGYKYDSNGGAEAVSKFFDPGYITEYVGAGYTPAGIVKVRLGFALRETIVSRFTMYTDDPETGKVENVRVDGGPSMVTELEWKLNENMLLKSKLNLFSPLRQFDRIIVRSDNSLTARISTLLAINIDVNVINEPDVTPRTQLKESLSLGLNYAIW
jgi:Protein of unknown function (DUF3078)